MHTKYCNHFFWRVVTAESKKDMLGNIILVILEIFKTMVEGTKNKCITM